MTARTARVAVALAVLGAWTAGCDSADSSDLAPLGLRYATAWSSQDPDRLASFYSEDGTLSVNGSHAVGREAIRATAAAFMAGFPDMRIVMDSIVRSDDGAVFYWTWSGTNTGPGGTGHSVHLEGYEEWTLRPDGLIEFSDGHYDEREYRLQVSGGTP